MYNTTASAAPGDKLSPRALSALFTARVMASLTTSMTAAYGTSSRIAGTLGSVELPQLTRCDRIDVRLVPSGKFRTIPLPFDFNGYEYEVRAVAKAIAEGRREPPECPRSATLAVTALMERLISEWTRGS